MIRTDLNLSPKVIDRPLPRNSIAGDFHRFSDDLRYEYPPTYVDRVANVHASGWGPLRHAKKYLSISFWITDNWSLNYFHWMCDALPRLEMASRVCDLSALTLLLPNKCRRHPYIVESLSAFELKSVRILNHFEQVCCRDMVLPSHVTATGNFSPAIMTALRDRLLAHIDDTLESGPGEIGNERIYLSRRKAKRRRIHNENELLPGLRDYGFKVMVAEELGFFQQLQLARQAKYLVSNHGAGLTNMIAMKPGGSVLEIRDTIGRTPNCFFSLAASSRLEFYYLLADRLESRAAAKSGDLRVETGRLNQTLQEMLSTVTRTEKVATEHAA